MNHYPKNTIILRFIESVARSNPHLRLGQILGILNLNNQDIFYEEPVKTLQRIKNRAGELKLLPQCHYCASPCGTAHCPALGAKLEKGKK